MRREMALRPDAPPPVLPHAAGGRDRMVEPHILQANASALFSAESVVEALKPIEAAAPPSAGVIVAKRWTLEIKGRDARIAARRVSMVMGALRDEAVQRRVEVESAAGERVSLFIAPGKNPKMVRTEVAWKKLLGELRSRAPSAGRRLLREEE